MSAIELLSQLKNLDIKITVYKGRLRIDAPKGAITPSLKAQLGEHKGELLALLSNNDPTATPLPPIRPIARNGALSLSFTQQRLWFLAQMEPDHPVYNVPMAFRLSGSLNVEALSEGFADIIARHEILRTTFATVNGQPVQVVNKSIDLPLSIKDLQHLPEDQREIEAQKVVRQETMQSFDLENGPLFRVKLLRLAATEHILLILTHHIIFDGWSYEILCRELTTLYASKVAKQPQQLAKLPIQYADFAAWQRAWVRGPSLDKQLDYWREQLADAPTVLQLPTDRPHPAVQRLRGRRYSFELPAELSQALRTISQQEGSTLFMTGLAAFTALLYRYTNQEDLIVGTPIANRSQVELEGLIGALINTLALRTIISEGLSFRELLSQVRQKALASYDHQDLPFEKLVEALQLERDISHTPLFQVMFMLQQETSTLLTLTGLDVSELDLETDTAKFDLTLNLIEGKTAIRGRLEYNTDIFDEPTIARLIDHFQVLLKGIVANPDAPIDQLPLLTQAERQQLLVDWIDTSVTYPPQATMHQLFEAQVVHNPEAVALVFEAEQLSYLELNRRANQLAHYLIEQGVMPGTLVGLYFERSLEMVIGILGVLKAGGAYVPLDPVYPPDRLALMLEDAQTPILLTQQTLLDNLPDHSATVISLDADWEMIATGVEGNERNQAVAVTPDHPIYVIYTSGSTGKPKGVEISHHNVARLFQATDHWYHFNQHDVWTLFHSYAFDFSVWELWGALIYGGQLVIVPYWVSRSPEAFYELLNERRVTVLNQTPSAFRQLIQADEAIAADNLALRLVIFGGEALELNSLQPWFERYGDQSPQLVNMYGITETTVHVTYRPLTMADIRATKGSVIGGAIPDLQLYILDKHLQPLPIGVPGELYVGGAGLAHGYLNRPKLTAKRFTSNPFSNDSQSRLYKTGDLVRYLPNQDIEYLGRIDLQVKIRGFRIELGEIETSLGEHPAIREVVVIVREDTPGDKRLVAYIVTRQGKSVTTNELRDVLKKKLPDYMVPAAFVFPETLPLTPNGKIDRRRLPAPDPTMLNPSMESAGARDLLEFQLIRVWQDVLNIDRVGTKDNFFDLGGQSLLAVRLMNQIAKTTGRKLSLAALFQAPTIEQQAEILRQDGWKMPTDSVVAIQDKGSKPSLFFVPGNFGNVFTDLGDLAQNLPPDQPIYGLQDNIDNPSKVKAMAANYLAEIKRVQPKGPYHLGGICSGGLVAFEMARQLKEQGDKVGLVAIVESFPHEFTLRNYLASLAAITRRFFQRLIPGIGGTGSSSEDTPENGIQFKEQSSLLRLKAKVMANMLGVAHYNPKVYSGRVDVFFTDESLESKYKPHLRWNQLAIKGADIHRVPGTHDSITGDHGTTIDKNSMKALATELKMCLDRALRTGKTNKVSFENKASLVDEEKS